MLPIMFFRLVVKTFYLLYFERYILLLIQFLGDAFEIPFWAPACAWLIFTIQTYFYDSLYICVQSALRSSF